MKWSQSTVMTWRRPKSLFRACAWQRATDISLAVSVTRTTVLFTAAHLYSTVLNTSGTTRYGIDFRTVNFDDVVAERGVRIWTAIARVLVCVIS
jgi:hypothetical protein